MRSSYNILWLDDDFSNETATLNNLTERVSAILIKKGFIPNIIKVSNKDEALNILKNNEKIDFFISDYNIGDDEDFSGFDFLLETRKRYKQEMLLYSNQDDEQIKKYILDYLGIEDASLSFFGKFSFESALRKPILLKTIEELIDLTLIRWSELNALRGLYLSETSEIHYCAKEYIKNNISDLSFIDNFNYYYKGQRKQNRKQEILSSLSFGDKDAVDNFDLFEVQCILSDKNDKKFYDEWDSIRKIRNGCAHVKEDRTSKGEECIILYDGMIIKESEIESYRVKLMNFSLNFYSKFN